MSTATPSTSGLHGSARSVASDVALSIEACIEEAVERAVERCLGPYLRRICEPEPAVYSVAQAAAVLQVSEATIARMVSKRVLYTASRT